MKPNQLYKRLVIALCTLLLYAAGEAQINRAEYYFDTDPGIGSANPISVTAGTDINFNFTASLSALTNGLHRLQVRTQAADGKWSISSQQLFYKEALSNAALTSIVKMEWFIDTDPGFGAGTAVTILPTNDSTVTFVAPVNALPYGLHRLFFRALDANGGWSLAGQQIFFREAPVSNPSINITKAEYFIDTDPGFGAATDIALTAGADISFSLNPSTGAISNGLHRLFVRAKDANGAWSLSSQQLFFKEAAISNPAINITKAEFFIDTDPGFGSATDVPLTAGADISFSLSPNIASLTNGLHRLYVRTKDAAGLWSITAQQLFFKEAVVTNPPINITKAEYFFDTDPGFGAATDVPLTAGADITFNMTADASALPNGLHRLFVRTRDAAGLWSITAQELVFKEAVVSNPAVNITRAEYFFDTDPGFGVATNIPVTAGTDVTFSFSGSMSLLTNGLHRLFIRTQDANGKWSISAQQLFYKEALINDPLVNIVQAEYYIDTDPGFSNGTSIALTAGQDMVINFTGNIGSLSQGLHRLFVRTKDANNKWSITAQQLFYKEVIATDPVTSLVTLEYFWDTDPGFGKASKVTMPGNSGEVVDFVFSVSTPASLSGAKHNLFVRSIDATDWSLTNVKVIDFTGIPLPVTLLDFSARAAQDKVAVKWITTNEINNKNFGVERSADGINFVQLGLVAAKGANNTQTVYDFIDNQPFNGMNYYRLKQMDVDGKFTFSPIVAVRFDKAGYLVQLFPNPATTQFRIVSTKTFIKVELADMNGKIVQQWTGDAGNQYHFTNLAAGMYLVKLIEANGEVTTKTILVNK